jgi:hypothetical protein
LTRNIRVIGEIRGSLHSAKEIQQKKLTGGRGENREKDLSRRHVSIDLPSREIGHKKHKRAPKLEDELLSVSSVFSC